MAILHPSEIPSVHQAGGLYREVSVIERLKDSLPDSYEIFHSVFLQNVKDGNERHGEIDVVVMAPDGNLLLMEIKSGEIQVTNGELYKRYSKREHAIGKQCRFQYGAMVNRLSEAGIYPYVSNCLVLPDYVMQDAHLVSMSRERIIDAKDYDFLGTKVRSFLAAGRGKANVADLRRFLNNEFQVVPNMAVMGEQLRQTVRQLSDGLANWVPRISVPSRLMRVQATAGSGKTQLAQRLLRDAIANSQSALYVCFNRALADHMLNIVPPKANVLTFHEACIENFRRKHGDPNFQSSGVFEEAVQAYIADSERFSQRYDTLIVDECQDFDPQWLQSLLVQLKPDGALYLLEDDDQRLYPREDFDLPDAAVVRSQDNFRSPQAIGDVINALKLSTSTVRCKNPYRGHTPQFYAYDSEQSMIAKTIEAVDYLLRQGFELKDIAIVCGLGFSKSEILKLDRIGTHQTRRFTGAYTRSGNPVWTNGELLVESVYRYKGQSAPAIVLTEFHFSELSKLERAKLFVGMTRAQMALEVVLSAEAEACFTANLAQ